MSWKPGDLAVCVNARPHENNPSLAQLEWGTVYTVERAKTPGSPYMVRGKGLHISNVHCLALVEIRAADGGLIGWRADRFRKLPPRKQISTTRHEKLKEPA